MLLKCVEVPNSRWEMLNSIIIITRTFNVENHENKSLFSKRHLLARVFPLGALEKPSRRTVDCCTWEILPKNNPHHPWTSLLHVRVGHAIIARKTFFSRVVLQLVSSVSLNKSKSIKIISEISYLDLNYYCAT